MINPIDLHNTRPYTVWTYAVTIMWFCFINTVYFFLDLPQKNGIPQKWGTL